jgi:hypothetical protein
MTVAPGTPNLAAVPAANAGCEAPTPANLETGATMLPGRVCEDCHTQNGQSPLVWTASGTVFNHPTDPCDPGGVAGVTVEILDAAGTVQATLTTNQAGNFYTGDTQLSFPIRARIFGPDGTRQEMQNAQPTGACASCHQVPSPAGAPGRITLNLPAR